MEYRLQRRFPKGDTPSKGEWETMATYEDDETKVRHELAYWRANSFPGEIWRVARVELVDIDES